MLTEADEALLLHADGDVRQPHLRRELPVGLVRRLHRPGRVLATTDPPGVGAALPAGAGAATWGLDITQAGDREVGGKWGKRAARHEAPPRQAATRTAP